MKRLNPKAGTWSVLGAAVLALAACSDRGDRPGTVGEKTQVLQENYTRESNQIGETAERRGEAEVKGRRETVTKRTERVREEIPTVVQGQRKADLNRMEVKDFVALGLNEKVAKNVVDYRKKNNDRFTSVEQLRQVPGMDMNWLAQHQNQFAISSSETG